MYKSEESDIRLDVYLSKVLDISRSQADKMIKNKEVLVNGEEVKNGKILK